MFVLGVVFEAGLALVAFGLAWLFGLSLMEHAWFSTRDLIMGLAATAPPFLFLLYSETSGWSPLVEMRELTRRRLLPVLRPLAIWQLAVIAVLAGAGEELLFRGVWQTQLVGWCGVSPGIALAGVSFGLAHCVSRGYAIFATGAGIYLGVIYHLSGNLLAPAVCHALYDLLALLYLLRIRR